MKYTIPSCILISLSLVGCQNPMNEANYISEGKTDNLEKSNISSISTDDNLVLPTYGSNEPAEVNAVVTEYEARNSGRLTIKDNCVTLTYPKDRYPNSTSPDDFTRMPIFPGGSKFIEGGQAIQVNGEIYRDGDYVEMSGRGTVREFWTSFSPDMPYTPVPKYCTADEYWEVGGTGLSLID